MIPHAVYLIFLILHLSAFALFTGTFVANIITGNQLWMRIKIGLVLIIIVFRILSTKSYNKFKRRLNNEAMASFDDLRKRLTLFQVVQLVLIGGIIILSVCRFN